MMFSFTSTVYFNINSVKIVVLLSIWRYSNIRGPRSWLRGCNSPLSRNCTVRQPALKRLSSRPLAISTIAHKHCDGRCSEVSNFHHFSYCTMLLRLFVFGSLLFSPITTLGFEFPMTVWGLLQLNGEGVPGGARVQFRTESGEELGELITTDNGQYGGNSAFDTNIALSSFQGSLSMIIVIDGESYTATAASIDDQQRGDGCPEKTAITFTSKTCRYDINIIVPACAQNDWQYSAWSNCIGGTQTRTASKKIVCTGNAPETISRSCAEPTSTQAQSVQQSTDSPTKSSVDSVADTTEKDSGALLAAEKEPEVLSDSSEKEIAPEPIQAEFRDISGHWSEGYIVSLTEKGILSNQEWFRPNEYVNRAEFLKSVLSALQLSTRDEVIDFYDVPSNAWYTPYVKTAYALGIVKGYPDGTFRAAQSINRAEGLKMLLQAAGIKQPQGFVPFNDVPEDAWFAGYVGYAFEHGIVQGVSDTHFVPEAKLTRAQMAKYFISFYNFPLLHHEKDSVVLQWTTWVFPIISNRFCNVGSTY